MGKWIAGILGTVIAGLLLAYSQSWLGMNPKPDDRPINAARNDTGNNQTHTSTEDSTVVMSPLEYGINRQGNDFDAFGKPAGNEQLCAELCRTDSKCDAVTYVKSTHLCWLKKGVPAATADADMVSSVKDRHAGAM